MNQEITGFFNKKRKLMREKGKKRKLTGALGKSAFSMGTRNDG